MGYVLDSSDLLTKYSVGISVRLMTGKHGVVVLTQVVYATILGSVFSALLLRTKKQSDMVCFNS